MALPSFMDIHTVSRPSIPTPLHEGLITRLAFGLNACSVKGGNTLNALMLRALELIHQDYGILTTGATKMDIDNN